MELRTLKTFVEVVRQGGFSHAAKVVFATQSTVSKAVKQLEDELGLPLLDRLGHKSRMTAAGEIVYRRAVRLLAERDDLQAELEELRGLKRGVLRLGLPPIGSSTLFAPLFAQYRQLHPDVEIRLVEHGSDRLSELLAAGDIDFAGLLPPIADEFSAQIVRREPLMALVSVDHPLARRDTITLAELRETPFILFEAGFALNRIIREACRRNGFEPLVAARSTQIDFIAELAGAGLGIAFLPRMIATQRTQVPIRLILLDEPDTEWTLAMAWRRGAYLSPAAAAWLKLVRERGEA
ncbi:putative transcriptional regulatory protein, LysR family [Bradyrhizobium sp. ORS 375]|uniref:LysR family transcriptional regulator n=1 Tax=Bradyrhizobium sp. (strain ORS 375) TaxID=566679 RepID=UPI0002406A5B|nr:LysR family transcriptional regulator [Bradyrhizobium sp. ORS 375]CCD95942.1 putative transcriptional regulatory protein, LysR family [Bradyrhizobium sp. ORS 375]